MREHTCHIELCKCCFIFLNLFAMWHLLCPVKPSYMAVSLNSVLDHTPLLPPLCVSVIAQEELRRVTQPGVRADFGFHKNPRDIHFPNKFPSTFHLYNYPFCSEQSNFTCKTKSERGNRLSPEVWPCLVSFVRMTLSCRILFSSPFLGLAFRQPHDLDPIKEKLVSVNLGVSLRII